MSRNPRLLATAWLFLALALSSTSARAVIIDFEGIVIPGETDSAPIFTYEEDGFSLIATSPVNGFQSGFQAHGVNSIFYAGSKALAAFAPASGLPNVIELTRIDGTPFSVNSIDLARNFPFDPAPTVTFTGIKAGGGEVMQSFPVTTPEGTREFQTFSFLLPDFTDLIALRWGQPVLAEGLHQFDDINIADAVPIPEPSTAVLAAIGVTLTASAGVRNRRRRAG